MENIENSSVFQAEIKAILAYKAKDGATYLDVKGKLFETITALAHFFR